MKYKIIYMGTPHYAREILQTLVEAEDMDVSLVLTQPDRPVGRKKVLTPPPVKVLAQEHGIDVLQPNRLSEEGIKEAIKSQNPDFIIVAAFGQILPQSILDIAPCINLHASLLPQYRGASPVQQSLLNGDEKTGVTSMLMEAGLDTGPMLEKIEFVIPKEMRLFALMEQLTRDACMLTLSTVRNFETITPEAQDESQASLCKKIKKSDGQIDFEDAEIIYNKYRAFEGWPGIFAVNGTKFDEVILLESGTTHTAGEILSFDEESVLVGCSRGALKIGILQPASKKVMTARAYCVGRGKKVGDNIL
ncbi:methionyl-tRNA formyltransferase [Sulfurovum sp. NBC37-1]|uniref:Methionyl-tRNA formyltransferase n=1 Tax=Sulfurovum sp. (strain NBC37-1) TaxID=387093 RepID=FMT_SULNB|nr:methionyl-tRNA formyltransferase [Sulfurovum sp. NBC37-1]A6QB68.1 RecName: Full=Methionyl-tRNA formyltransferase [Sulfurovum sp. NBC37-1]BAF72727.1 methionyl-tRNA formyltransferase [Sulfurovum sp. NBC37-1]